MCVCLYLLHMMYTYLMLIFVLNLMCVTSCNMPVYTSCIYNTCSRWHCRIPNLTKEYKQAAVDWLSKSEDVISEYDAEGCREDYLFPLPLPVSSELSFFLLLYKHIMLALGGEDVIAQKVEKGALTWSLAFSVEIQRKI